VAEKFNKAFEQFLVTSGELYNELYEAAEDKDEFWAKEHWINNPLITPVNKVDMLDSLEKSAFDAGEYLERKRVSALILDFCNDNHSATTVCDCADLVDLIGKESV